MARSFWMNGWGKQQSLHRFRCSSTFELTSHRSKALQLLSSDVWRAVIPVSGEQLALWFSRGDCCCRSKEGNHRLTFYPVLLWLRLPSLSVLGPILGATVRLVAAALHFLTYPVWMINGSALHANHSQPASSSFWFVPLQRALDSISDASPAQLGSGQAPSRVQTQQGLAISRENKKSHARITRIIALQLILLSTAVTRARRVRDLQARVHVHGRPLRVCPAREMLPSDIKTKAGAARSQRSWERGRAREISACSVSWVGAGRRPCRKRSCGQIYVRKPRGRQRVSRSGASVGGIAWQWIFISFVSFSQKKGNSMGCRRRVFNLRMNGK
jgi:hypothetical protein